MNEIVSWKGTSVDFFPFSIHNVDPLSSLVNNFDNIYFLHVKRFYS